ncbi:type II toxin-antitoxin system YafQ family toxin [Lacticaseibacillus hulanensis]|uniref:type II toxin-antitoxin system RelE/ParE family toxin n=1 Tax=Lacticaseibacillus hulanensis TaxID=2493111 RepID=UPI00240E86CB|nr:type II toxin-antitoxin system mRNA interferase toxin, RelE/StbE family [Lacticaseibacillus hulanensis]
MRVKQARAMQHRGADLDLLRDAVVAISAADHARLVALSDHALKGAYKGDRELHVGGLGDWLLRYRVDGDCITLLLLATGTHREVLGIE